MGQDFVGGYYPLYSRTPNVIAAWPKFPLMPPPQISHCYRNLSLVQGRSKAVVLRSSCLNAFPLSRYTFRSSRGRALALIFSLAPLKPITRSPQQSSNTYLHMAQVNTSPYSFLEVESLELAKEGQCYWYKLKPNINCPIMIYPHNYSHCQRHYHNRESLVRVTKSKSNCIYFHTESRSPRSVR